MTVRALRSAAVRTSLLLALVAGCNRGAPSKTIPRGDADTEMGASKPQPSTESPPAFPAEDRYACRADADCFASCSQGAVAWRWYVRALPGGESCEGGCAAKGMGARCDSGACVAVGNDDSINASCTRKQAAIERPGPAHACASDADCGLRCDLGALNLQKAGYLRQFDQDCRGGCLAAGMSARCESGRCLALRMGQRYPECTERSIHAEK